jgi:hypothetical protein
MVIQQIVNYTDEDNASSFVFISLYEFECSRSSRIYLIFKECFKILYCMLEFNVGDILLQLVYWKYSYVTRRELQSITHRPTDNVIFFHVDPI